MPPRKRKSTEHTRTSKRVRTSTSRNAPTPTPASKSTTPPAAGAEEYARPVLAARATGEYAAAQQSACQRYSRDLTERCISCIQKQASFGTCRFIGIRVFRYHTFKDANRDGVLDDYRFASNQDLPALENTKPRRDPRKNRKEVEEIKRKPVLRAGRRGSAARNGQEGGGGKSDRLLKLEKKAAERREAEETAEAELVSLDLEPAALSADDAAYIRALIAPTFLFQVRRELRHENTHLEIAGGGEDALPSGPRPLIRIKNVADTRSACDICATGIFMGSYMCGCCGRELCLGCWESWVPADAGGEGEGGLLRRVDQCSLRRKHTREAMIFLTRARPDELRRLLEEVEATATVTATATHDASSDEAVISKIPTEKPSYPDDELEYLPTPKTHHASLSLAEFQALWRKGGVPLILTGLGERFKLPWDDAYFTAHFGDENCVIHDCLTGVAKDSKVRSFFENFSDDDNNNNNDDENTTTSSSTHSWKLKDWPPSADFADEFPLLFRDFEQAVPFPSYTRRTAQFNLARYFPRGWVVPDLGPKMYNAYPAPDFLSLSSTETETETVARVVVDVKGTTNLHLDLTDAVNIMLYAAEATAAPEEATTAKGIPPCGAVWDIFPPSSAAAIRAYLNRDHNNSDNDNNNSNDNSGGDDPIHLQHHYLSEADLVALSHAPYNVRSHRIYQNPGDAVFIPAGCPHQVRNRSSAIKVAVDFVAPEHVAVCQGLVEEARAMAKVYAGKGAGASAGGGGGGGGGGMGAGKEDVLQFWTCLGFAWAAAGAVKGQKEGKEGKEEAEAEAEAEGKNGLAAAGEGEGDTDPAAAAATDSRVHPNSRSAAEPNGSHEPYHAQEQPNGREGPVST